MRRPVNEWAQEKGHVGFDAWKFEAAKKAAASVPRADKEPARPWVEGAEVTEEEYDAAVKAAESVSLGYSHAPQARPLKEWSGGDPALLKSVMAHQGWSEDQQITQSEFEAAKAALHKG